MSRGANRISHIPGSCHGSTTSALTLRTLLHADKGRSAEASELRGEVEVCSYARRTPKIKLCHKYQVENTREHGQMKRAVAFLCAEMQGCKMCNCRIGIYQISKAGCRSLGFITASSKADDALPGFAARISPCMSSNLRLLWSCLFCVDSVQMRCAKNNCSSLKNVPRELRK